MKELQKQLAEERKLKNILIAKNDALIKELERKEAPSSPSHTSNNTASLSTFTLISTLINCF